MSQPWTEELAALRARAEALRAAGPMPDPIRRADGEASFARLRAAARTLFDATIAEYQALCPKPYPLIDDNEIPGTGGAVGIRFSEHHSFFFSLERVRVKQSAKAERPRAAQGDAPRKRMPGDPLPETDPNEPVRLAMIALRWDEQTGWSEVRRVLDPRWDERLLREHLAAYLTGIAYDMTVGAAALRERAPARIP